jgi:cellulose 1,4-beta-cellobiosidase
MKSCILSFLLVLIISQNIGKVKRDTNVNVSYAECTAAACTAKAGSVTMAAECRWLHYINNYTDCFTGSWDRRYCPDALTCAKNCGYEGVSGPSEYTQTYGVLPLTNGIRLNYVTYKQKEQNVGSRLYFL